MLNDEDNRPVVDGRRGSRRGPSKGSWFRWLCNPLVLKAIIASARFGYELVQVVLRH